MENAESWHIHGNKFSEPFEEILFLKSFQREIS